MKQMKQERKFYADLVAEAAGRLSGAFAGDASGLVVDCAGPAFDDFCALEGPDEPDGRCFLDPRGDCPDWDEEFGLGGAEGEPC